MPTGRKPKPTKLKLVDGNPGKTPINDHEPQPDPLASKPPSYLDRKAKRHWRDMAPALKELGLLTDVDKDMFAAYCTAYSRWREAEDIIEKEGLTFTNDKGEIKRRPETTIAKEQMMIYKALAAEFGLTPSSRSRVNYAGQEGHDDEDWLFGSSSGKR